MYIPNKNEVSAFCDTLAGARKLSAIMGGTFYVVDDGYVVIWKNPNTN